MSSISFVVPEIGGLHGIEAAGDRLLQGMVGQVLESVKDVYMVQLPAQSRADPELVRVLPLVAGLRVIGAEGEPAAVPDVGTQVLQHQEAGMHTELLCQPDELIGVMADYPVDLPVPQFTLEDAAGVVDLLERLYLQKK